MNSSNAEPAVPKLRVAAAVRDTRRAVGAQRLPGPPQRTVIEGPTTQRPPQAAPGVSVTAVSQPTVVRAAIVDSIPTPNLVAPQAQPPPLALVPVVAPDDTDRAEAPTPDEQSLATHLRHWVAANLRIGQVACWQLAVALVGLTIGRPWPVLGAATLGALTLLALTALRLRERWLYQWAWRYLRFRTREHTRYLPREGGSRALLHLLAPDATVTSMRVEDDDVAVLSRLCGATAVLRPQLAGADPIALLPRPESLLPVSDGTSTLGVQLVFHGVGGNRRTPWAWIAVQAVRTPDLVEEDEVTEALYNVVRRVLRQLAKGDIAVAGLDEAKLMHTLVSLAHVSDGRSQVCEQWRCWCCGSVAQAGFRLAGWADLEDTEARLVLRRLLTATAGAVVTVAVSASAVDGMPLPEFATMRVAAPGVDELERSVERLRELAAVLDVRLDRMDGEHATAVAASLPLGVHH